MATTGIILGRNYDLSWGGTVIDHLKSVSFSQSTNVIDITTYDSSSSAASKAGTRTSTISFTALVAFDATEGFDEILADSLAGTEQTALLTTAVSGDTTISATGFLSSFDFSGDTDSPVEMSGTIQLTDTVTQGTVV